MSIERGNDFFRQAAKAWNLTPDEVDVLKALDARSTHKKVDFGGGKKALHRPKVTQRSSQFDRRANYQKRVRQRGYERRERGDLAHESKRFIAKGSEVTQRSDVNIITGGRKPIPGFRYSPDLLLEGIITRGLNGHADEPLSPELFVYRVGHDFTVADIVRIRTPFSFCAPGRI